MTNRTWMVGLSSMFVAACSVADTSEPNEQSEDALAAQAGGLQDTYVSTSFPASVRGARTELKVGHTAAATQDTYLRFDVSGVPAGATNVKATLAVRATTTTTAVIEAHAAKSAAWQEATLVEANAPGAETAVLAQVPSTTAGASASFDVSAAVKGNGTYAFVLTTKTAQMASFASKEAGAATAPKLTVTYDTAPTTTLTTAFGAGFKPHDDARYDELIGQFGGMQVARSFDASEGVNPFLSKYQAQDIARKAISAYSFKYMPADVIAGKHDAALRTFFQGIVDDHPVYWTYWHEPDEDIYKDKRFTATQYRQAWAHIKAIANSVKSARPRLKIFATSIIMEYSMRPTVATQRPLLGDNGMYPGDDVIDVFGVDSYNSGADNGSVRDVEVEFGKVIDFAKAHGKPWAIGEIGSCPIAGQPSGRAQFLTNAITYWKSRSYVPVFAAYFDLDWPSCDYRLDTDSAAKTVWKTAVTKGYAAF